MQMFDEIKVWFETLDMGPFMEHMGNEQIIGYITHPVGIGVTVSLIVFAAIMKWRITFVGLSAMLAGIFVARYTITDTGAPSSSIFLFIAGGACLGAFIVYFTLMQDD
jgi:hypothetical protein